MIRDAKRVAMELPDQVQRIQEPAFLSGMVTDEKGKPISNAYIRLEQDGKEIADRCFRGLSFQRLPNAWGIQDLCDTRQIRSRRLEIHQPASRGTPNVFSHTQAGDTSIDCGIE